MFSLIYFLDFYHATGKLLRHIITLTFLIVYFFSSKVAHRTSSARPSHRLVFQHCSVWEFLRNHGHENHVSILCDLYSKSNSYDNAFNLLKNQIITAVLLVVTEFLNSFQFLRFIGFVFNVQKMKNVALPSTPVRFYRSQFFFI